jgi:sterol O-acyltransferase
MAASTSFDLAPQNGHAEYHQPRARKPTKIDLLKPQLSDETLRSGFSKGGISGTSRYWSLARRVVVDVC